LFQRLGLKTALAYVLSADGVTDAEVPVKNYGFDVVYRRSVKREWLFIELRPGLDWRPASRSRFARSRDGQVSMSTVGSVAPLPPAQCPMPGTMKSRTWLAAAGPMRRSTSS
jgi:hypothetical protein